MPKFYTAFDRPPRASFVCCDESRTVQDFSKECDINNIVKRAQRTGTIPVLSQGEFVFGVMPNETLQDTMNRYNEVRDYFDALPSDIRLKFGNSPMTFAEWVSKAENWPEAQKMGLIRDNPAAPASVAPTASEGHSQAAAPGGGE